MLIIGKVILKLKKCLESRKINLKYLVQVFEPCYGFNDNIFIVSHGIFLSMLEVALNNQPIEKEKHLSNCKYFTHRLTNVREK